MKKHKFRKAIADTTVDISGRFMNNSSLKEGQSVEKVYKTMKTVGVSNIVIGILTIVIGIGFGVTTIVNGARLIHGKSKLVF
jgi:hypothetical protein